MTYGISLAMIVRDEAHNLERCLTSIREYVDEMVVIDTGSTDNTIELATSLGATVYEIEWPNDFAAARNEALLRCTHPWRLVIDADEWFISGDEFLAAARKTEPNFIGVITIDDEATESLESALPMRSLLHLPRLLPVGTHYDGRVHEQPVFHGPLVQLDIVFGHDGYMPAAKEHKADRNRLLLEQALEDEPDNAYLAYSLGRDHEVYSRFAEACTYYARAYASDKPQPWRHDLVVRYLAALNSAGRTDEAVDLAETEDENWQQSADFAYVLGHVALSYASQHPEHAAQILPVVERAWLHAIELGDTLDLPGSVRGRGSYYPAHNLIVFYESLGHPERAEPYRALAATMPA